MAIGPLLALAGQAISRRGVGALTGGALAGGMGGLLGGLMGGDGGGRRRRRKALTTDDMRIALTIASAISKKAAENFILVRSRGA